MKNPAQQLMTRRVMLKSFVGAASAVALPALGWSPMTRAGQFGSVPKSAVQYQNHPKGVSSCADCINFIPGKRAGSMGHCTVVAGDISPKGWCLAYAAKG